MKSILKKYMLASLALAAAGGTMRAQSRDDFRLGTSAEIMINVMRDLDMFYVDSLSPGKMLYDAAAGITANLDPYTGFMPAEEMEQFEVLTTGKYGGIGSLIRQKGDRVVFAEPYKGSPADRAGIKIGDALLAIDGHDATGFDATRVSELLRGDPGTVVVLTIEKLLTGEAVDVSITRERIMIPGVPYYGFINDSIGYIRHVDFTEDCSTEFRHALMELKNTGRLRGLVLDYRSNGGGILQEAVKILSLLVPRGTEVVSMRGRSADMTAVFRTESEPVDTETPVVVLVNSGTASAAEIVSGALQDLDRAVLVGQRTYGKGLVQSPRPVGYNAYLKITTAKYYIPSGRCIQAIDYTHRNADGSVGLVPDSMITEFRTRAGRRVYDGGGVMPDVRLDPEYLSRFSVMVYTNGYIDDYVDAYMKRHTRPVDIASFRLSEADWNDFVRFMEPREVRYESETQAALNELKAAAARELYDERIGGMIVEIERDIAADKAADLTLYRDQLSGMIEDEIVLRDWYSRGVVEFKLTRDGEILSAVALAADRAEYERIVTEQDTRRK